MGASFRPSVLPEDRDFLDTVTRAFAEGRAFIERERESRRRQEEFETQQQLAGLRRESLEQDIEAQNLATRVDIAQDPSLVTGPEARVPLGASVVPPGRDNLADLEAAFMDQGLPQPGGIFDNFTGIETPPQGTPAEVTVTGQPDLTDLAPLEDRPDLFGTPEGDPVQLPELNVSAPPARPGVPPPAPPSVDTELADILGGQPVREFEPPIRPGLTQVGTVGGDPVFFDPSGQQRQQSVAGDQIRQLLNGLAAREESAGRQGEADQIRRQINGIVAQVEAGNANPADLVGDIIAEVRLNAQLQQFRDFLAEQVGEENLPSGLNELPLAAQVEELQNVRTRLQRPPRAQGQTGQLSEASIAGGVRQLLEQQGIDPNTATNEQINQARTQFMRFARGVDPGAADIGAAAQQQVARREQLSRLITRAISTLEDLDNTPEVEDLRDTLEELASQAGSLEGDELISAIRVVIERQREIDRARS